MPALLHLVQQRLEQVVGRPRNQLDVDVGPLELLGGVETAEARTDDDDLMLDPTPWLRGGSLLLLACENLCWYSPLG